MKNDTSSTVKATFPVTGLSCASCAISSESMLKSQKGVINASVNFASSSALVEYDPKTADIQGFKTSLQSLGYDLIIPSEEKNAMEELEEHQQNAFLALRNNTIWAFVLSVPVAVIGMFFHHKLEYGNWISMVLTLPVVGWFGRIFFVNAWKQASHKQVNMDTLVAVSTGIAFLYSTFNTIFPTVLMEKGLHPEVYFESAAIVIAFILLGKLLEEKAKSKTSGAIKKLMGLQPKTVKVIRDRKEIEIRTEEVLQGDMVMIRPGEKIPVDGTVLFGKSYLDESMISGESFAVEKSTGANVYAGTINQKGTLTIQADKIGSETLLAQIIRRVEEAQGSKAPIQKLVDKVAMIFVPAVMGISVITFLIWILAGGGFTHALISAITVLIIACPCALGLATPTAIMVGIGKGAEKGILIKDAVSLEKAYEIDALILDKTGTLTVGKPGVTDLIWANDSSESEIYRRILVSIEKKSEHPLAEAIVACFPETLSLNPDSFDSITGKGITAKINGKKYYAGNLRLMEEHEISIPVSLQNHIHKFRSEAKTVVFFAEEKELIALIAIADVIKQEAAEAVQMLQSTGIEVYMLTGDNQQTAEAVAKKTGIRNFHAEMLPSGKAEFIRQLQQQGKIVAMAGDGINDSEALATADVSIAMGKGTDIAMEVAQVTLINSDLKHIFSAVKLSRATLRTIRANLFWAFIYNVIGIPLAAGILYPINGFTLEPMLAGAAMAMSSVSVVLNSLRLKLLKL